MTRIFKFELPTSPGNHKLFLPKLTVPRLVGIQGEAPFLWAECEGDSYSRTVSVAWTGHERPAGTFIGTALLENGAYVLHYYLGDLA